MPGPRRDAVVEALGAALEPLSIRELADLLGVAQQSVRADLRALSELGRVARVPEVGAEVRYVLL